VKRIACKNAISKDVAYINEKILCVPLNVSAIPVKPPTNK